MEPVLFAACDAAEDSMHNGLPDKRTTKRGLPPFVYYMAMKKNIDKRLNVMIYSKTLTKDKK